jgi:hypothetical protein
MGRASFEEVFDTGKESPGESSKKELQYDILREVYRPVVVLWAIVRRHFMKWATHVPHLGANTDRPASKARWRLQLMISALARSSVIKSPDKPWRSL